MALFTEMKGCGDVVIFAYNTYSRDFCNVELLFCNTLYNRRG
jgi:hypothetical protein